MTRRLGGAAAGAAVGTTLLVGVLAASPVRPTGWWVALVILGVLLPAAAAAGAAAGLRVIGGERIAAVARLTAVGSPVMAVFLRFFVMAVFSTTAPGAQEGVAMILGAASAAALAGRYTPGVDDADGAAHTA